MSDLALWQAARKAWTPKGHTEPELREPQLAEQMGISRAFVAQHLEQSEAAVSLNAIKCVAEAVAGRWVSQTAVLGALLGAGFRIRRRRDQVQVFCRPSDPRMVRALSRGTLPAHHELVPSPTAAEKRHDH